LIVDPKIEEFVSSLIARLEREQVFASVVKEMELTQKNWDTVAKKMVGPVVKKNLSTKLS